MEKSFQQQELARCGMEQPWPLGQKINLPGHFHEPVILEAVREIVGGVECQVRLPDGTLEEAILSPAEAALLVREAKEEQKPALSAVCHEVSILTRP